MHHDFGSSAVRPAELAVTRAWLAHLLGASDAPARHPAGAPFSFQCGSRSSHEWLTLDTADRAAGDWADGRRMHHLRWTDPDSGLTCDLELTEYRDFPALEWVIRLRHDGDAETDLVTDFRALDILWRCPQDDQIPVLARALGSDGRHDDFQMVHEELRQSMWSRTRTIRMDTEHNNAFRRVRNGSCLATDGRPSATWLPFFNLRTGDDGLLMAVGWSGQWFAEFAHDGHGATTVTAGMEHLAARLRPGETIRSPRMLVLYWQGTPLHGHNLWRRFLLAHHRPEVAGERVAVPLCNGSWGGTPTAGHLAAIAAIAEHRLPYDVYWIDAGWYGTSTKPCPNVFEGEWGITGDWRVNPLYHPDGLRPISEAAHAAGLKLLLWIEPERARYGTPVTLEHPEWFLRRSSAEPRPNEDLLLNLGDPAAWQWAVDTVSGLIEANGLDCYREDFNLDPSPYWRQADVEGRRGLVELRFVEGLYAFWDELRRRHPNLLIDNCASGGRRLELELLHRSVPLWRSDYNCFPDADPDAVQLHGLGLHPWLPQHAISPPPVAGDTYQVRSCLSSGLVLSLGKFGLGRTDPADFPWAWFRERLEEARRLRPLFEGDFYPLTPGTVDPTAWLAYQLLVPETGEGAVVAFRRPASPQAAATWQLSGLPAGDLELQDADSGDTWRATGDQLRQEGLTITLPDPRSSRVVFYRVLRGDV